MGTQIQLEHMCNLIPAIESLLPESLSKFIDFHIVKSNVVPEGMQDFFSVIISKQIQIKAGIPEITVYKLPITQVETQNQIDFFFRIRL